MKNQTKSGLWPFHEKPTLRQTPKKEMSHQKRTIKQSQNQDGKTTQRGELAFAGGQRLTAPKMKGNLGERDRGFDDLGTRDKPGGIEKLKWVPL